MACMISFFVVVIICKSPGLPVRQARQALVDLEDARALLSQEVGVYFLGWHVRQWYRDYATQLQGMSQGFWAHHMSFFSGKNMIRCFFWIHFPWLFQNASLLVPSLALVDKPFQHLPKPFPKRSQCEDVAGNCIRTRRNCWEASVVLVYISLRWMQ